MKRYHVTTRLGDKTITFQEPLDDPFVRHTVVIGWRDLLRGLLHGELPVTVILGGDRDIVRAVMNLNADPQRERKNVEAANRAAVFPAQAPCVQHWGTPEHGCGCFA